MKIAVIGLLMSAVACSGLPQQTSRPPALPVDASAAAVRGKLGAALDARMDSLTQRGFSGAVLVAIRDDVVLRHGYGLADRESNVPVSPSTVFHIGSVTKQFTGAAILKLEQQGKLALTDRITRFFPDVPADKRGITIHHLLTHTAGITPYGVVRCSNAGAGDVGRDEFVRLVLDSELIFTPGQRHRYSNTGYNLLGAIIEIASGTDYETYLKAHLFHPAGMFDTGYSPKTWSEPGRIAVGYRPSGERWGTIHELGWGSHGVIWCQRASGAMLSTVDDLYRWYHALRGGQILTPTQVTQLFTPYVPEDGAATSFYGYGWAVFTTPRGTRLVAHNGDLNAIFEADYRMYLDEDVLLIIAGNSGEFGALGAAAEVPPIIFGSPAPASREWPAAEWVQEYTRRAGAFGFTGGVLIVESGEVRHVAGYGHANRSTGVSFGPTTVFDVGSFTKQFTAVAVLKLAEQGRLALTDSLSRFLPSAPADKRAITIHQLLSNTSGLAEYSGHDFELIDRAELIVRAMKDSLAFPPGTRYQYSNVGFSILAAIVELASGQSYERYLREHVFGPAGMPRTGYVLASWDEDSVAHNYSGTTDLGNQLDKPWLADGPSWNLRGNGGMLSTLEDLSRWYRVLRDGRVLSAASVERLSTAYVETNLPGYHYGYAAFIRDTPYGREVTHGGGASYGTSMNFRWFPEADALVTFVINQPDIDPAALAVQRAIGAIVAGRSVTMPPRATATLTAGQLVAIAGTYELPSGQRFVVEASDSGLVVNSGQSGIARVLLATPDSLFVPLDPELEQTVLQAVRAMAQRRLDPFIGLADPARDLAEDRRFWTTWVDTTAARLGAFRDVETVAVLREPSGSVIHMWATFERGARPVASRILQDGRVAWGFRPSLLLHEYRFVPLTRDRFVTHHLWHRTDAFIDVVRDAAGAVSAIMLTRNGLTVHARRVL